MFVNNLFSSEVIEVPGTPEDVNFKIIQILSKVNPNGYVLDEKTRGFIYRYNNTFISPFNHKIYIGRMSKTSIDSIVRVESSDKGQEKVWKQVLEAELLRNVPAEDAKKLEKKSYFTSQALNIIQPSLSVIYNSWDSPFYNTIDTIWASSFYILIDLILVGGAYAYAKNKAPRKSLWDNILNQSGPPTVMQGADAGAVWGALALTRMYRVLGSYQDTKAHNTMFELEYSFKF